MPAAAPPALKRLFSLERYFRGLESPLPRISLRSCRAKATALPVRASTAECLQYFLSCCRAQPHQQDVCRNKSVAAPGCKANDRFKKEVGWIQRMASSGSPRLPQSGRVSPDTWFLCTAISDKPLFHLF